MVGGIAINTAHELGHKRKSYERWLSKVALAQTGYGHFFIEHNRGHHVRVATPEDPASSRLGESFWEFLPRTVWGSLTLRDPPRAGAPRPARQAVLVAGQRLLNAWAMTAVLFAALTLAFGDRGAAVAARPGRRRLLAARGRQLPRALRPAAPARGQGRPGALRALPARALLELEQRRLQRVPLPPPAALRPPRQPGAPLPGAAPLRRGARAALGLRDDDRARLRDAALAAGDGPEGGRPLRRRRDAGQPPPAQAGADDREVRGARLGQGAPIGPGGRANREQRRRRRPPLPGLRLRLRGRAGRPARGLPRRDPVVGGARDWCCPDCGVREKADFEPVAEGDLTSR